jgi:hypothetical protein
MQYMKTTLRFLATIPFALMALLTLASCTNVLDYAKDADAAHADTVVTLSAVHGVNPPALGETPVTTITETTQYTGSVTWSDTPVSFAATTTYTATISLTAKAGFTLTGVAANFFTVAGSTSDVNPAESGVVTAVFPETATTATPADIASVATAKTNLVATTIQGSNADLSNVKVNLYLPATGADGTTISWSSNTPAVVANDGSVTRPTIGAGNATVIMTATISKGDASDTKTFSLTVLVLTASTYTITFDANGGSGSMDTQSIDQGSSAMLLANAFTRATYSFTGWATAASGGVAYNDKQSYTMGSADLTLYAVWTLTASLQIHYSFDGQTCADSSGNAKNGTPNNITYVSDGNGGYAASFNGSSSSIVMPYQTISNSTTFTVMMRFKTGSTNSPLLGYQLTAVGVPAPGQFVPIINIDSTGHLVGDLWNGSAHFTVSSGTAVNDGAWHTVYFSAKPSSIALYLDGVQLESNSSTVDSLSMFYNQIGAANLVSPSGWYYFNGLIDDFYFYTTALH